MTLRHAVPPWVITTEGGKMHRKGVGRRPDADNSVLAMGISAHYEVQICKESSELIARQLR